MHRDKKQRLNIGNRTQPVFDEIKRPQKFMNSPIHSIEDFKAFISEAKEFRINHKRPFITISYAQSVDGSIASVNKEQIHLSGLKSLALTHQLRACCDVIVIGIGTLLADNPQLTVRLVEGENPQPIVLDTRLRTPVNAKLIHRADMSAWIVNGVENAGEKTIALKSSGATPMTCATAEDGKIDLHALMQLLTDLEVNSVMVEGGSQVITSFVNARLVDQFIITIAPKLVGGLQVIDTKGFKAAPVLDLGQVNYQPLGNDLIMWARPKWETE